MNTTSVSEEASVASASVSVLVATEYSRDTVPYPMEKVFDGKYFDFEVLGPVSLVPQDFPSPMVENEGLKLPSDWEKMIIVVDGLVSFSVKGADVTESESIRKMLQKQKAKKRNICFPDYEKPPAKLRNLTFFYRYIVMYRDAKTPLFFIGFDTDAKDLDKGFWFLALELKSRVQNPKSAKPK